MDSAIIQFLQAYIKDLNAWLAKKATRSSMWWKDVLQVLTCAARLMSVLFVEHQQLQMEEVCSVKEDYGAAQWLSRYTDLKLLSVPVWVFSRYSGFLPNSQTSQLTFGKLYLCLRKLRNENAVELTSNQQVVGTGFYRISMHSYWGPKVTNEGRRVDYTVQWKYKWINKYI